MGAWGSGPFENDGALDALAELADDSSCEMFGTIFSGADEDYVETDAAEAIVAAAALLAGLACVDPRATAIRAGLTLTPELKSSAVAALKAVLTRSETAELWAEAAPSDHSAWRNGVEDIIKVLDK